MTSKTIQDCSRCPHLPECDAYFRDGAHRHSVDLNPCAPILDAEKGNEILQKTLETMGENGSGILTRAAELELVYQKK